MWGKLSSMGRVAIAFLAMGVPAWAVQLDADYSEHRVDAWQGDAFADTVADGAKVSDAAESALVVSDYAPRILSNWVNSPYVLGDVTAAPTVMLECAWSDDFERVQGGRPKIAYKSEALQPPYTFLQPTVRVSQSPNADATHYVSAH